MTGQMISQEILEQLSEIGRYLINISDDVVDKYQLEDGPAIPLRSDSWISTITTVKMRAFAKIARQEYQSRLKRQTFLSRELFGEPAWDILLDLYIARIEGIRLSVTAVCIGSQVPLTTALRWITVLEQEGLLQKFPDPSDARRTWIELSDLGFHRMYSYFDELTSTPAAPLSSFVAVSTTEGGRGQDS